MKRNLRSLIDPNQSQSSANSTAVNGEDNKEPYKRPRRGKLGHLIQGNTKTVRQGKANATAQDDKYGDPPADYTWPKKEKEKWPKKSKVNNLQN